MSTSVTSPIRVCSKWGQPLHRPLESSQGGAGAGGLLWHLWLRVCGVCARATSCWVRTGMSPPATTSLGSSSCSEQCWGCAVTEGCPYTALPCPSSPGHCPRDSRGTPPEGPWAHGLCSHPQEVLPHSMHLLSWGAGRWHRTCPCTALLSLSAPQTLGVPPSLTIPHPCTGSRRFPSSEMCFLFVLCSLDS